MMMRNLKLSAVVAVLGLSTTGLNAAVVTGVTFSRAADTGTTFNTSNANVTSLSVGSTTYDVVNPIVSQSLTPASATTNYFYANNGTNPGSFNAAAGPDVTDGVLNVTGNVFFNTNYQSGDLIYLFDISDGTGNSPGNDSFNVTLINSGGTAVSSAKTVAKTSFQNSGRSVAFKFNPGGSGTPSTQTLAVVAFLQNEFSNVIGPVAGLRISATSSSNNSNNIDLATAGTASVSGVPEPTSIALLGLGAAGLLGRRRRSV